MGETWNKKEREKKKQQLKKEKLEKKQQRKENMKDGKDLDSMLAYIDENGNLTSVPPDPRKRITVKAEDIVIGVPKGVEPMQGTRHEGIVSFFNDDKGFGFIRHKETQQSIFVHISALEEEIREQQRVTFEIEKGPKGPVATLVKIAR
jgi:cold shock CspA family protein